MKCPRCNVKCDCTKRNEKVDNPWQNIPEIEPKRIKEKSVLGEFSETHPAFACIRASRVNGGKGEFFGSGIKHNHFISVTISQAERVRDKYGEHHFERNRLIEVQMTNTQWADFITTMNYGSGSPCTLRAMEQNDEYLPFPTFKLTGRQKEINDDLKRKTQEIADKVLTNEDSINTILNKSGAINKGEREELRSMMKMMHQDIKSNLPFLASCMQRSFDKIVHEAKGEIEAHLTNAINMAGKLSISDAEGFKEGALIQIAGVEKPKRIKRIKKVKK